MQAILELLDHHRQATGVVEVFHQVFARRHQVDEERLFAAEAVEVFQFQRHADAPGNRQQVDDEVGRSADGGVDHDGVLEGLPCEDFREAQVLAHHFHNAVAHEMGGALAS